MNNEVSERDGENMILRIEPLLNVFKNRTLLYELLKPYGITAIR
jgi:hypothetical protein